MASLNRATSGLSFADNFNRANGPVGGGWSSSGLANISGNKLNLGTSSTSGFVWRVETFPVDYILESLNVPNTSFANNLFGQSDGVTSPLDGIDATHVNLNQLRLQRRDAGVTTWQELTAAVITQFSQYKMRLIAERSLPTAQYRNYWIAAPVGNENPVLVDTHDDGIAKAQSNILVQSKDSNWDNLFLCGRNVVINGLQPGWQILLDAVGPFVAVGTSITINVDAINLPFAQIQLLNPSSGIEDTQTPTPGIYGGDVWDAVGVPPPTPTFSSPGRYSEFIAGDLVVERTMVVGDGKIQCISGLGVPTMVAPVGSEFWRTDGPPWVYIYEPGGWVSKIV